MKGKDLWKCSHEDIFKDFDLIDFIKQEGKIENLKKAAEKIIQLDAAKLAREAGSHLTTNIVMLGALFGTERLPIKIATIKGAIEKRFPAKVAPINIKAFDLGYEACKRAIKR